MLVRFVVENFLSFKDETEFHMLATEDDQHPNHVSKTKNGIHLLKTTAIYGANGSGKSNLIKAISFLKNLMLKGTNNENEIIDFKPFKLDETYLKKPTKFEVELLIQEQIYAYGIVIFENRITEEWLYLIHNQKNEELIFERTTNAENISEIKVSPKLTQTDKEKIRYEIYAEELRPNQPFISEGIEKKLPFVTKIRDVLHFYRYITPTNFNLEYFLFLINQSQTSNQILNLLVTKINTGVSKLHFQDADFDIKDFLEEQNLSNTIKHLTDETPVTFVMKNNKEYGIYNADNQVRMSRLYSTHHENSMTEFEFREESDGTKMAIALLGVILTVLFDKVILFIDEIDRSLHPQLTQKLLEIYASNLNPEIQGQLIFTTHESNLLDLNLLRRDEVWFTEKDKHGATHLYSLSDFKPDHYGTEVEKGYLEGRFGAIPFFGNLEDLNWSKN